MTLLVVEREFPVVFNSGLSLCPCLSCFCCGTQSLESLLKAKTLELEQVSATCQNLRWLKEEIEAKSGSRQKEQEGIIQQLQTCLHDRNKEVEVRP